jgi:hypothetical protein
MQEYLHLGVRGMLLDVEAYRQQRDAPDAFKRGALLVLFISFIVAIAALIGSLAEYLVTPDSQQFTTTLYEGLTEMPWYQEAVEERPDFAETFRQQFDQISQAVQFSQGGGITNGLTGLILIPLVSLLSWFIYGGFAHLVARMFGGSGTLKQTLACTALASGVSLLGVVQLVPFAQAGGMALLALLANYLALREAHHLSPTQAFWATILGPLLLMTLFAGVFCLFTMLAL